MKLIVMFSAMSFMARKIFATKNLNPEDEKKVVGEQLSVDQEIGDKLKDTIANLEELIKLEEANFYSLCDLDRTKEIEAQEKLSVERLIILEEQLEKLIAESEAFKSKVTATEKISPALTEVEEPEELEEEEEESEVEEPEETEEEDVEEGHTPSKKTSETKPSVSKAESEIKEAEELEEEDVEPPEESEVEPPEEAEESEEEEVEGSFTPYKKTSETKLSVSKSEPEIKDIAIEAKGTDVPGVATTSTKDVQPENILGKTKRKESEVMSEPHLKTKGIGPQTSGELESSSSEGEGLSETETKREKQGENVSSKQTGAEVSHESFVSTGKATEPSPEVKNVLKPDDDKQKNDISPGVDTIKNELEAQNRLSEFLWLLLIMSIIGVVFSTLWVLLN